MNEMNVVVVVSHVKNGIAYIACHSRCEVCLAKIRLGTGGPKLC